MIRHRDKTVGLLVMACSALIWMSAHRRCVADLIDDFSTPQGPATDFTNDAAFATNTMAGPTPGTILPVGGERRLRVSKTNERVGLVEAEILPGGQIYDTLGGDVTGQFTLDYLGLDSFDLSGGGRILLTGSVDVSAASGPGTSLGVQLHDSSLNTATQAAILSSAGPFELSFPLAGFSGVDLARIDQISIGSFDRSGNLVNVPPGGDVSVRSLQVVPEPETLLSWLIVLGVALLYRTAAIDAT